MIINEANNRQIIHHNKEDEYNFLKLKHNKNRYDQSLSY